jgi:transcriptional regulator NrdR family protein
VADSFASHFDKKIQLKVMCIIVIKKSLSLTKFHRQRINKGMYEICKKSSEEVDRILQRIIVDGDEHLFKPLKMIYKLNFEQRSMPL